ncbi:MAG: Ig-like domain-containing protein [Verrucomicrobia bacterium]|nr:Ig-like domain-containing protein [Verrucomicrobiota bacterium]
MTYLRSSPWFAAFRFALLIAGLALAASPLRAVGPTVSSVTPPANGTYLTGQTVSFTVNFNLAITVTGTPQLSLAIGGTARTANYVSGSGTTALVFSYTVQGTDSDMDGMACTSPLVLNGGTLKNGATDAILTFTPPSTPSVLVGLQRTVNALGSGFTIFVRPGGTSNSVRIVNGDFGGNGILSAIQDYSFHDVGPPINFTLTRGQVQYSSNGGASWTTVNTAVQTFVPVAGKIWRFVDTSPADTTYTNNIGEHWHLVSNPGSATGNFNYITPDNAPTDITSNKSAIFSNAATGDTLAILTPTDTGDTRNGYWALESQSVPNLFTLTSDTTVGNTATLKLGTGTMPALGQTPTVTVRYYDVYQNDASGLPIPGQGFVKTLTYTVVSETSNDLSLGNDVAVNTYTTSVQSSPSIAQLSTGSAVVVWQSAGQGRSSTSYSSIRGQILSSTGTAMGSEFLASNSGTTVDDITPSVAALNAGRFVVAYATKSGSTYDIAFRIIEANGTLGSQVSVKAGTEEHYNPAVATLTDGSFVVVWSAANGDVRLHRYNAADGSSAASEVLIADGTSAGGYYPGVGALSNGSYAVAWIDNATTGVFTKVGGGTAVNTGIVSAAGTPPRIAGLASGFVVVSDSYDSGTTRYQIDAARYNNSAVIQGSVFRVNTVSTGNRYSPSIATLSGGGFVVGWTADNGDYDLNGLFGRRYASNGTAVDVAEFQINQHRLNDQAYPALAPLPGDLFAATWVTTSAASIAAGTNLGDISARFLLPGNTAPVFVGATTTLAVNQNASATDLKSLLHVNDADSSQTLTWTQSSAPSHGTLTLTGATASSGSTDVTPGGTLTYTPTAAYFGSDSFTIQVSDGTATATRTISVTVSDVTAPTVLSVVRKTPSSQSLANGTATVTFTVTYSEAVTGVAAARFAVEAINGGTVTGTVGTPVVVSASIYDVPVTITGGSGEFRLKVLD